MLTPCSQNFSQNLAYQALIQNIPQIVQWSRRLLKLLDQDPCLSSNFNESPLEFIKAMQLVNVTDAANYASKICATLSLPQVLSSFLKAQLVVF